MIVRVWSSGYVPARLDDLAAFCTQRLQPFFRDHDGCLACFFVHDDHEWRTITCWRDQAAVDGVKHSAVYTALLGELLGSGILQGSQSVLKMTSAGGGIFAPLFPVVL
ncbi:hypothetical protein [Ferrovibrio sp.]|uniref:hypothetical protein n=1 Tax=Ferrovibrio sp. TaxID=1917215 RepID=UPI0035170AAB